MELRVQLEHNVRKLVSPSIKVKIADANLIFSLMMPLANTFKQKIVILEWLDYVRLYLKKNCNPYQICFMEENAFTSIKGKVAVPAVFGNSNW